MQPLQDLLHRIQWDEAFGQGRFELGYVDRVAHREHVVPVASVSFDPQAPGMLSLRDPDDIKRQIPIHRVRTVYRDGQVIWQRRSLPPPD